MAFEDVGSNMTKKMGPFPVWVWGVLIGGAFVVWYWVSQRDLGSGEGPVSEDSELGTVAPPSGDFSTVPVMPPSDGEVDDHTNLEWSIQALNAVTGTGVSLIAAQTAISKYLNGERLSSTEVTIIDKVLKKIGPPPEGVSTPDIPTPTPKPTESNNTTTTVSGATTRRFGQSTVIYIATKWSVQAGHSGNPGGSVSLYIDDVKRATLPLINGKAIYVITPFKGMGSTKDKRWVVRATYVPSKTSGAKSSVSNLHLISLS